MAKRVKKAQFRNVNVMAGEPVWDEPVTVLNDIKLNKALNWYNSMDGKDRATRFRRWLVEYMESQTSSFLPHEVELAGKMEDHRLNHVGPLARILSNGCEIPGSMRYSFHMEIRARCRAYEQKAELRARTEPKPVVRAEGPSFDRAKENLGLLIGSIEEMLDSQQPFSVYEVLRGRQATIQQARAVSSYYAPLLAEVQGVKGDSQLKEAYRHMSRADLSNLVKTLALVVSDADRYAGNKTAVRKPRKKKEKSSDQLVSGLQFQAEDKELKLASVNPATIPGSGSVWLYNTRYKTLRCLSAPKGKSLSVRGSTIVDFDPQASETRTLRKPAEVISRVLGLPPAGLKTVMGQLTTKPSETNGRCNRDTIILRTTR